MQQYGKTDLELEADQSTECREIVKRILDFGVSQKQILHIIYLFALELENNEHMKKIAALVNELKRNDLTYQTSLMANINNGTDETNG